MMFIHAFGSFVGPRAADIKVIKAEVSRHSQVRFRRANRFVLISLAGACRCVRDRKLDKRTAVYLTTENGNLGDTETVLNQIYHRHEFPMPYNFINTMSNTASFYVAQSLGLQGRNITFASKQLSFERGLELLHCDMLSGVIDAALLGGADEACFSQSQFEAKFNLPYASYAMVEGSSWLLVKREAAGAAGVIRPPASFGDIDAVVAWLERQRLGTPLFLAFGLLPSPDDRARVGKALTLAAGFDYVEGCGYFDSATACGVTHFLGHAASGCLVHVNKDFRGQFVVVVVEKF